MTTFFKQHIALWVALAMLGLAGGWPFVGFPLTDADIAHWVPIAREIQLTGRFLTSSHDQTHGPILAWTAAMFGFFSPHSFFLYNAFNWLCGLWGLVVMYVAGGMLWGRRVASLAVGMAASSLSWVYLSRTPMYDWPAAMGLWSAMMMWWLWVDQQKRWAYWLAWVSLSIAGVSRFSITLGLMACFVGVLAWVYRRGWVATMVDWVGLKIATMAVLGVWLVAQYHTHGNPFVAEWIWDNVGRYIKEPGNAPVYRDYYGFTLIMLVGLLPHTFMMLGTLLQKGLWKRWQQDRRYWVLLAGWVPCLLLFSFSGHVKLARYISYVFPMAFLFLSVNLIQFDLHNPIWVKRVSRFMLGMMGLMALLLTITASQFPHEVAQSPLLVGGFLVFVVGLMTSGWLFFNRQWRWIAAENEAQFRWKMDWLSWGVWGMSFGMIVSILAVEYHRVPYLKIVRDELIREIRRVEVHNTSTQFIHRP